MKLFWRILGKVALRYWRWKAQRMLVRPAAVRFTDSGSAEVSHVR